MGFSGHLVFARSDRPLLEAPVFDGLEDEAGTAVHTWESRPAGRQTLQLDSGTWDDADPPALVGWSGAPACAADVSDSSLALVTGLDPSGRSWQAWLNPDNAAGLLAEEPEDLEDELLWLDTPQFHEAVARKRAELDADIPADAEGALAWAAAAGVPVPSDPAGIERLLRADETLVEDLFDSLLDLLGFPRVAMSSARSGGHTLGPTTEEDS